MSFLRTLPVPSTTVDIFASLSHIVYTLIHFLSVECLEEIKERIQAREGKMDAEIGRQVFVWLVWNSVSLLAWSLAVATLSLPCFSSLLLSHLHRNVQLDLIREAEGKSNWAGDQILHMGTGLVLRPNWPWGQATKTENMWTTNCLLCCEYFWNDVSVCLWAWLEEGNEAGRQDVNVSLRWQQQHSHTLTCVWHKQSGESVSLPFFLLCSLDVRADIKFLSTSSRWGPPFLSLRLKALQENRCLSQTYTSVFLLFLQISVSPPPLSFPCSPPLRFMTVYAKWQFLLSLLACGWPKQINKSTRTHINSQTVCAHPTSTEQDERWGENVICGKRK